MQPQRMLMRAIFSGAPFKLYPLDPSGTGTYLAYVSGALAGFALPREEV